MPFKTLEVGKAYMNAKGRMVEIVSVNNADINPVFKDTLGREYAASGLNLNRKSLQRLVDRAQKMEMGATYDYAWKDGGVARFVVTSLGERSYDILWSNGDTLRVRYGCPLNYDALKIAHGPDGDDGYCQFDNGWSMRREYGLVPLQGETEITPGEGGVFAQGKWVLRNDKNDFVEMDKYSNDILGRWKLNPLAEASGTVPAETV